GAAPGTAVFDIERHGVAGARIVRPALDAALRLPGVTPAASTPSLPLARLLDLTADAVQQVRAGKSLTDVIARVPAEARPAVQALAFHVMRWLGGATEVRKHVAAKAPPPQVESL